MHVEFFEIWKYETVHSQDGVRRS